jgi:hypothetical protein
VTALAYAAWFWAWPRLRPERPAEAVAARFAEAQPLPALALTLERRAAQMRLELAVAFNPRFVAAPQPLQPLSRPDLSGPAGARDAFGPPVMPPAVLPTAAPPAEDVPLPPDRPEQAPSRFVPDDRVFNDRQIASLKQRLRLAAAQQPFWDLVEAELRTLQWQRGPNRTGIPRLDVNALLRLRNASDSLMENLREDQKREVRLLMQMVGMNGR